VQVWAFETKITLGIIVCVGIQRPDEKQYVCVIEYFSQNQRFLPLKKLSIVGRRTADDASLLFRGLEF